MHSPSAQIEERSVLHRRFRLLEFLVLFSVGLGIFLVTGKLIAGAILPAIYAGWSSFRTAWWILCSDHNIARRRICATFCIATGFWKVSASAFSSVITFLIVAHFTGNPPDMQRFATTMITLTSGVALTTLVGLVAAISAAYTRTLVWVHPRLREITDGELNEAANLPPLYYFNHGIFVLATSLAFPLLALASYLLIDYKSDLFSHCVLITSTALALISYVWLSSKIIATHPEDCWNDVGQ